MYFAYLIMAHENSYVLKSLLKLLDDSRNDIFIHLDAKTNLSLKEELAVITKKSRIYFIRNRINVFWAHISQVEAEYLLFEEAYSRRKYCYYHLLSGSDLPIKTQNEIHEFFRRNYGREFIGFSSIFSTERVKYLHVLSKYFRYNNRLINIFRTGFIEIQKAVNCTRFSKLNENEYKKGTNWVSVTDKFVEYLLSKKANILTQYKYAKSPDEYYKQTLAYNSTFKESIYCLEDEFEGCMRLIDWERGNPYTWKKEDLNIIFQSDKLFARKFNDLEKELIDRIVKVCK